ncbi:MAG: peroxiredoxin [Fidelibacterota bacterium]
MKTVLKASLMILFSVVFLVAAELKVGEKVPSFKLSADDGEMWHSDSLESDYLVVYFYPAAMTFGCTKQACSYRDNMSEFEDLNAEVVGISGDEVEALQVFKEAHDLNFTLLSDSNGKVAKLFGVPYSDGGEIEKEMNDEKVTLKRGVTTKRWTFILDNHGKVIYKDDGVNPMADAKNVLKELQND